MTRERLSVIAFYPISQGFSFAFFTSEGSLFDWGVKRLAVPLKRRNVHSMTEVEALLDRYYPEFVVLEDWIVVGSRRCARIRRLYRSIVHAAGSRSIEVKRFTRRQMRETYSSVGAKSRHEIAQATAREFPALAHRLPKCRRPWESERPVLTLFLAAALAVTFYRSEPGN